MRVTIYQAEGEAITLKIEGKVGGVPLTELHRAWEELARALGQRKLLVDLRGVTHVDVTGRKLLAEIHAETGAEFLADTPLTKYFAEQARQGIRTISNPND
jgi:ABC-type transporter Mla MlaB component